MNDEIIPEICSLHFGKNPEGWERCSVGFGNYVFIVKYGDVKYILRCSEDEGAYSGTVRWLGELSEIGVHVPEVLFYGRYGGFDYLILSFIEGRDIGVVYGELTADEKMGIAREVTEIQKKVSRLDLGDSDEWDWNGFIDEMLETAERRIIKNGYFDREKVRLLKSEKGRLREYFEKVRPISYLDDISTKNLLIYEGKISGIIDVDKMGAGDSLTFIALTYVALLNERYDTDYVEYLLSERGCADDEMNAFLFYSLMFCVDFMGERGCVFGDKKVAVNEEIICRLNGIFDMLWGEWRKRFYGE
ncbi:MAG: aminoglycoside phosphotransferase family protein [Oscillospiraceae bacterium]|nr:aminoglycoside phosphotransferase family protein [Oscillospiraceae bacterium]